MYLHRNLMVFVHIQRDMLQLLEFRILICIRQSEKLTRSCSRASCCASSRTGFCASSRTGCCASSRTGCCASNITGCCANSRTGCCTSSSCCRHRCRCLGCCTCHQNIYKKKSIVSSWQILSDNVHC